MGILGHLRGAKRLVRDAGNSPPFNAEVKNMWSSTSIICVPSWSGALALISALRTVSILSLSHVPSCLRPCFLLSAVYFSLRTAGWVSGTHSPLGSSKVVVLFYELHGKRDLDQLRRRCQDQTIPAQNRSLAQTLIERRGPSDNKDGAYRILISRTLILWIDSRRPV